MKGVALIQKKNGVERITAKPKICANVRERGSWGLSISSEDSREKRGHGEKRSVGVQISGPRKRYKH